MPEGETEGEGDREGDTSRASMDVLASAVKRVNAGDSNDVLMKGALRLRDPAPCVVFVVVVLRAML